MTDQENPDSLASVLLRTRAEIARRGLHDLYPYWSPDFENIIDPFDDQEIRATIRRTLSELLTTGRLT